jgi:hypothetical protein
MKQEALAAAAIYRAVQDSRSTLGACHAQVHRD